MKLDDLSKLRGKIEQDDKEKESKPKIPLLTPSASTTPSSSTSSFPPSKFDAQYSPRKNRNEKKTEDPAEVSTTKSFWTKITGKKSSENVEDDGSKPDIKGEAKSEPKQAEAEPDDAFSPRNSRRRKSAPNLFVVNLVRSKHSDTEEMKEPIIVSENSAKEIDAESGGSSNRRSRGSHYVPGTGSTAKRITAPGGAPVLDSLSPSKRLELQQHLLMKRTKIVDEQKNNESNNGGNTGSNNSGNSEKI